MSEGLNAGTVYYTVEADTAKLLKGVDGTDASLDRLNKTFGKTDKAASLAEFELKKTAAAVRDVNRESAGAASALGGLQKALAGVMTVQGISSLIQMTEQYGEMAERVKMATGSQEEYEMVQQRILSTANGTYRALSEAQELYIRTSDSLRSMGYSADESLDVVDSLSYGFVRSATSSDRAKIAIGAFSRSLAKGRVDSDAWEMMLISIPTLAQDMATAMGKTSDEVRKLGASGDLTTKQLTEGLRRSLDANKTAADGMAVTVRDAFTSLRNNLSAYLGEANNSTGITGALAAAIKGLGDNIGAVSNALLVLGGAALAKYVYAQGTAIVASAKASIAAGTQAINEMSLARAQAVTTAATIARTRANGQLIGQTAALVAAENAHAASLARVAMAQRGVISVLGGPVGMIAALGFAAYSFFSFSSGTEKGADSAQDFSMKIAELTGNIKELKNTDFDVRISKTSDEIKKYIGLIDDIHRKAKDRSAVGNLGRDEAADVAEYQRRLIELGNTYAEIKKQKERFNASSKDGLADASEDAEKYIDRLKEQALMIGKNTELEKARALLDSGRLAASESQRKSILSEAKAIDEKTAAIKREEEARKKAEDQAEAARKAAQEQAQYNAALREQVDIRKRQIFQEIGLIGLGDRAKAQAKELLAIQERYAQERKRLADAQGTDKGLSPENYAARLNNLKLLLEEEVAATRQSQAQMDEIRSRGGEGVMAAWNNYLENARDISGQFNTLFTNAFSGAEDALVDFVKTGKMDLRSLGETIMNDVIRMFVKMGVVMLVNAATSRMVNNTAAAGYVAQVTGQVGAQTALAAQAAFASTAAIPIVGPGLAPGAAAAAAAAAAALGAPAISSATGSMAGRRYGGPVAANSMYRINENGAPEVYNAANGQQFLLPNRRGEVVSNKEASGQSGGTSVVVEIHNNSRSAQVQQGPRKTMPDGREVVAFVINDIGSGGEISKAIEGTYGLKRRGR